MISDDFLWKIDENWLWSRLLARKVMKIDENGLWSRGLPSGEILGFWRPLVFLLFPYLQMALPTSSGAWRLPGQIWGVPPPSPPWRFESLKTNGNQRKLHPVPRVGWKNDEYR